jgi:hypothetical protein
MFNRGPAYGEGVGEYRAAPLYHASLSPDEYTALLSGIGFEVIAHAVVDWNTGGGRTVWLGRAHANRMGQAAWSCRLNRCIGILGGICCSI